MDEDLLQQLIQTTEKRKAAEIRTQQAIEQLSAQFASVAAALDQVVRRMDQFLNGISRVDGRMSLLVEVAAIQAQRDPQLSLQREEPPTLQSTAQQLLSQFTKNLGLLKIQAAKHGAEIPLHLQNQIDEHEVQIIALKKMLAD